MTKNSQNINTSSVVKILLMLLIFSISSVSLSYADQLVYSIQAGSFHDLSDAQNKYALIEKKSAEIDLESLRIEKIGKYFTVRFGKIEDYPAAEALLALVKPHIPDAMIMKAYIKNERIVKIHEDRQSLQKVTNNRAALSVAIKKKDNVPVKKAREKVQAPATTVKAAGKRPFFRAIDDYPQTVDLGMYQPDYFRKLSIALYNRGFVDEAVVEMEKAVNLSPDNPLYRIELGTLYLAHHNLQEAKEQYYSALRIQPALSKVYYYLGELFIETGDLDMAWFSARIGWHLGLTDNDLIERLGALSKEPDFPSRNIKGEDLYMRQILVFTSDEAKSIMKRFSEGELFEDLAFNESYGSSAYNGGYVGPVRSSDIHPAIARELLKREIFDDPVIVSTENGFHIVQRILPFELDVMEKLLFDPTKKTARKSVDQKLNNTLSSLR
jgi:tetratricopeptide (TPR) repeat protein